MNKGYVTIEAAIFLSIMILAIISIASLMKGIQIVGQVDQIAINELRSLAIKSYTTHQVSHYANDIDHESVDTYFINEQIGHLSYDVLEQITNNKIEATVSGKSSYIKNISVKKIDYDYLESHYINAIGLNPIDLIDEKLTYEIDLTSIGKLGKNLQIEKRYVIRQWHNERQYAQPLSIEELEKHVDEDIVIVFTKSGTKYHLKTCRLISSKPMAILLTEKDIKKYKPCQHCIYKSKKQGELAYVFSSGDSYHNKTCYVVSKQLKYLTKDTAVNQGYEPCQICKPN